MPGPKISQQNIPLWGFYQCSCCQSQRFIVVTHLCLSVLRSQLVFTAPKCPKKVRSFSFDMSHVKAQICVSGLLLLEAQLHFCVWLSWRRWYVSLVVLFEVLWELMCRSSDEELGGRQATIVSMSKVLLWILRRCALQSTVCKMRFLPYYPRFSRSWVIPKSTEASRQRSSLGLLVAGGRFALFLWLAFIGCRPSNTKAE